MDTKDFRVRAAPSPTGRVHTGNLRTFLNNYLFARNSGGTYVLRIEDTDQRRKVEGGMEGIIETLELYGIEFDESPIKEGKYGPYIQSQRLDLYKKYAEQLVQEDKAYY
jgi:glutamyl/glutaminyl-tRNA synthetase